MFQAEESSLIAPAEGVKTVEAEDDAYDAFDKGFAVAEAWAGETKNDESPWVMAINGDRCFYWRGGEYMFQAEESSLIAPAEGVRRVKAEDDDAFEEGFAEAEARQARSEQ
jgi:hypothetical protein